MDRPALYIIEVIVIVALCIAVSILYRKYFSKPLPVSISLEWNKHDTITIPSNISLHFSKGTKIHVPVGKTLIIEGPMILENN